MKDMTTTRSLLAALAAIVLMTLAPLTAQAAGDHPAMSQGAERVLKENANTDSAQTVYYANNPWRVIGYGDTEGNEYARKAGMLTLFSAANLTTSQFNPDKKPDDCNDYGMNPDKPSDPSILKATVDSLFNGTGTARFSDKEQAAVVERILEMDEYSRTEPHSTGVSGSQTSGYLWPLSTAEALHLPSKTFRSASGFWWLRSPGGQNFGAAGVKANGSVGTVGGYDVSFDGGVRPAFYLNLSSVLFISAAVGGKGSGPAGPKALEAVGTNAGDEWKLTLKDDGTIAKLDGHKDFNATYAGVSGKVVSVQIDGAKKGAGEWISAIVRAESGDITYYGRVALCSDDVPLAVSIDLEGKFASGDKLLVFNEQVNDDKKTDYASELKEIALPPLYTVSFDMQGQGTDPNEQTVFSGQTAAEPAGLSKTGYTFGWYKEAACTNKWDFTTDTVTTDTTLYAGWTAHAYTVSFDINGGDGGQTMAPQQRAYGDGKPLTKNAFTNTGHRFTGWRDEANDKSYADEATDDLTTVSGDIIVLKAQWDRPLIVSNDLPAGRVKAKYSATVGLSGASGAVTWAWSGTMPKGLKSSDGIISGKPTEAGSFDVTVRATDSAGAWDERTFTLLIEKAKGPAAPTGLVATPPTAQGMTDGAISGVDPTMEWSADDGETWTDCPASGPITGLKAGTYWVRVKETATTKTGESATVTVPESGAHVVEIRLIDGGDGGPVVVLELTSNGAPVAGMDLWAWLVPADGGAEQGAFLGTTDEDGRLVLDVDALVWATGDRAGERASIPAGTWRIRIEIRDASGDLWTGMTTDGVSLPATSPGTSGGGCFNVGFGGLAMMAVAASVLKRKG